MARKRLIFGDFCHYSFLDKLFNIPLSGQLARERYNVGETIFQREHHITYKGVLKDLEDLSIS